jgi:hypothetical protein
MTEWVRYGLFDAGREWLSGNIVDRQFIVIRARFLIPPNRGLGFIGISIDEQNTQIFNARKLYTFPEWQTIQFDPLWLPDTVKRLAVRTTTFQNHEIEIDMPLFESFPPNIGVVTSQTAVETAVAASTTPVLISAANANRKALSIQNTSTGRLHLKMGNYAGGLTNAQAIAASTITIPANGYFEIPISYTGIINGVFANTNGNAQIVEYS